MATTSKYFKEANRMATRQNPPLTEAKAASSPPEKQTDAKVSLEKVFAEVTKMNKTLQVVAADTIAIKETMTELKDTENGLQVRMEEVEGRISQLEDATGELATDKDAKENRIKALWDRVQMLENHSKRNNARLVGLKEKYGTNGTLESCVKKVLSEGLGIDLEGEFEIERVHRTLAPMPSEDQPPRPVLIRFLRQSAREKILRAARAHRGIEWEGAKLSVFPDMTRELAEKRKMFLPAKKALQQLSVRYTLAFPAILRFTWKGRNRSFTSTEEAERFISTIRNVAS
ncbi:hypothetical protein QQF64_020637 [Cirrhinus molitorella]|uniref:L1 transposable element RRM domain-containing protein n=1 Tax=Cirrhinus molitorella TaxID=172907 RepID=A0ABR3L9Q7_9TELE